MPVSRGVVDKYGKIIDWIKIYRYIFKDPGCRCRTVTTVRMNIAFTMQMTFAYSDEKTATNEKWEEREC